MIFSNEERLALQPTEKLLPSEWAEQKRYIASPNAPEVGRWKNSRTPYLVGIMDAVCLPEVSEIVVMKAAQVGYSEALVNLTAFFATEQPGPLLLVLPNDKVGGSILKERIYPTFHAQEDLAALLPTNRKQITKDGVQLATMPIYIGYSGSASSLASRSIRYVFLDEVDKFTSSSSEANPMKLAVERTATFGNRRKIIYGCTPTNRLGNISQLFDSANKRFYFNLPCPHCKAFQPMEFTNVKWTIPPEIKSDIAKADYLLDNPASTYYQCQHCGGKWTEADRIRATQLGQWLDESGSNDMRARRIAFHLPRLISQWTSLAAMAAEFLLSKSEPTALQNFNNSWRGLPHEEIGSSNTKEQAKEKLTYNLNRRQLPEWCYYLVSSADTQLGSFYYSTYAFGPNGKTACVDAGIATTTAEIKANTIDSQFFYANGASKSPTCLLIDSGGIAERTAEVYSFAATDKRIVAIKGASTKMNPPVKRSSTGTGDFNFYMVDTETFKDQLAYILDSKNLSAYHQIPPDWLTHLTNEHKVAIYKVGNSKYVWKPKSKGAPNHYLDCAVYALAGLYLLIMQFGPIQEVRVEPPNNQAQQNQPRYLTNIGRIGM